MSLYKLYTYLITSESIFYHCERSRSSRVWSLSYKLPSENLVIRLCTKHASGTSAILLRQARIVNNRVSHSLGLHPAPSVIFFGGNCSTWVRPNSMSSWSTYQGPPGSPWNISMLRGSRVYLSPTVALGIKTKNGTPKLEKPKQLFRN